LGDESKQGNVSDTKSGEDEEEECVPLTAEEAKYLTSLQSLYATRGSLLLDMITNYPRPVGGDFDHPELPPASRHKDYKIPRTTKLPFLSSPSLSRSPAAPPSLQPCSALLAVSGSPEVGGKDLSCLYCFEAERGRVVVAPVPLGEGNDLGDVTERPWISLTSLNRLRRLSPPKVNPMWHDKFDVLKSLFDPTSPANIAKYSDGGSLIGAVESGLLNIKGGVGCLVWGAILSALLVFSPILLALTRVTFTSQPFWDQYNLWSRIVYAPLPLKIYLVQVLGRWAGGGVTKIIERVREGMVDRECERLDMGVQMEVLNGGGGGTNSESDAIEGDIDDVSTSDNDDDDDDDDEGDEGDECDEGESEDLN